MVADKILKDQLKTTLEKTNFKFGQKHEGKVRDSYVYEGKRMLICTDRLSAFDVVLTTIPFKGQILNQLSAFWFEKTAHLVPNHFLELPDPNVTIAKNCSPIPIEFIVRGYITGVTKTSMWFNYNNGSREFCGHRLPEGLKKDQKLDYPLITPTTKAEKGSHDELVSRKQIVERGIVDGDEFDSLAELSLKLFEAGTRHCAKNGVILVDTKYEFGRDQNGELTLIDEIHTPDSSRFWYKDTYMELFKKAEEQRKIDKEYVRKWLSDKGFTGDGKAPKIPDEVRMETAKRYVEAYRKIVGKDFTEVTGDALPRIKQEMKKRGING